MSRNLTLNEITVTTIADNVDANSESESQSRKNVSFIEVRYKNYYNLIIVGIIPLPLYT